MGSMKLLSENIPSNKINVFISSICGAEEKKNENGEKIDKQKYIFLRKAIKYLLESTHLMKVYLFEDTGASSSTSRETYLSEITKSDVCVFIIDNNDGVTEGVQREIDEAEKLRIKSLYFFCSEYKTEKTLLQQKLEGNDHVKTKTVSLFEDLIRVIPESLINEINNFYIYSYGFEKTRRSNEMDVDDYVQNNLLNDDFLNKISISKVDKCKNYFYNLILNKSYIEFKNTSLIDEYCLSFLKVLFEEDKVRDEVFIGLKNQINKEHPKYFDVISKRYEAIVHYFSGNTKECINELKDALCLAENKSLPKWIINDILIDLRNQQIILNEDMHEFTNEYQKKLSQINKYDIIYNPILDRLSSDYYKAIYIELFKTKINNMVTIMDRKIIEYIDLIVITYIRALYTGSLTYLYLIYDQIMDFCYYYSEKFSNNWYIQKLLIKMALIGNNIRNIEDIVKSFNNILSKLDQKDAIDICKFVDKIPLKRRRVLSKIEAFKITAYFLNAEDFYEQWEIVHKYILDWMNNGYDIFIGNSILDVLEFVYIRLDNDKLVDIFQRIIRDDEKIFYRKIFKIFSITEVIGNISKNKLDDLVKDVIGMLENIVNIEDYMKGVLIFLNKTNNKFSIELESILRTKFISFYNEINKDSAIVIHECIEQIIKINNEQKDRAYFQSYSPYLHIKNEIENSSNISYKLICSVFRASLDTILNKHTIDKKITCLELMIFLLKKYPQLCENQEFLETILNNKDKIEDAIVSNIIIDTAITHLRLYAFIFYKIIGCDKNIDNDILNVICNHNKNEKYLLGISRWILFYLENCIEISNKIKSIILLNAINWSYNNDIKLRINAVKILLSLLEISEDTGIICSNIIKLMDTDIIFIKNIILNKISQIKKINIDVYNYILTKARADNNFVIRNKAEKLLDKIL